MKANQQAAIKKLEAALLSCKRAGLVLAGIDDNLFVTVDDAEFKASIKLSSACEVMLERHNTGHQKTESVKHYGCYRDSGGA